MKTWIKFLEQKVDQSQIDRLYSKAHIAVEIVQLYNPKVLNNISTIANLATGAYGIYMSGENKKILPPTAEQKLIYFGKINRHNLDLIPKVTIQQYYPDIKEIKESDTIHVNVRRIMLESGSDLEAILEIASTIIHESRHEEEFELTGKTSEVGPEAAEHSFMQWATTNLAMLRRRFPDLEGDLVGPKGTLPAKAL